MQFFAPRYLTAALLVVAFVLSSGSSAWARKHSVRLTTEAVEVKGWEHSLIKNNPNLAHWHWNPIYGNPQTRKLIEPSKQPGYLERVTIKQQNRQPFVQAPSRRSEYIKPIHIPFTPPPAKKPDAELNGILTSNSLSPRMSRQNVNANLAHQNANGNLSHQNVNGTLSTENVSGILANNQVAAQLASRDVGAQLSPPAPVVATYDNYKQSQGFSFNDASRQSTNGNVYGRLATKKVRNARPNVHF